MTELSGTILGFDFGTKKIGIAIGQTITATANPLQTITAKDGKPNWQELQQLIDQWQPVALVVGRPVHMDGSEQPLTKMADKFANRLRQHYKLPVIQTDERLSSQEAEALLDELHGKNRYDASEVDKMAASLILQSWLQQRQ
ncbi:MAG: Holliday junction resolvase RuvX [Gammaproteobacteria bacterium]|nr:Holliday junction resolvase RuvX [Gammaproteobacteria bacterium]